MPPAAVASNNGPLRGFLNQKAGSGFAVRLNGAPGNPDAVGTRVKANFADGSTQTVEIGGGHGYLSQSSPQAFFHARPTKIAVRWPDGSESEHSPGAEGSVFQASQPENN